MSTGRNSFWKARYVTERWPESELHYHLRGGKAIQSEQHLSCPTHPARKARRVPAWSWMVHLLRLPWTISCYPSQTGTERASKTFCGKGNLWYRRGYSPEPGGIKSLFFPGSNVPDEQRNYGKKWSRFPLSQRMDVILSFSVGSGEEAH
jgi:hypothetical protein